MADSISLKKLVTRLLGVVVAMFVFGFALVPIYDVMCKAFGINGKTAGSTRASRWWTVRGKFACSFCRPTTSTCRGSSTQNTMS